VTTGASATKIDPITFQIVWARLISVADEIAATLVKTSFSLVVRDNHDYACGIYDISGRMLAQSLQCTPGQAGATPRVVAAMLERYPAHQLSPGDVIIANDPWLCAGHAPDVFIAAPVFRAGKIVGVVCNSAHHIDMGGRLGGTDAREVYEEGLIIPITKLMVAGQPNDDLFRLLRRNVRAADKVIGDLRAQMAANHVGARGVVQMMDETGLESLETLADEIIPRTEAAMRAAIAEIPDGVYAHSVDHDELDPDGKPIRLVVRIEVAGDRVSLDYTGTSPQVPKPINAVFNITRAYSVFPFVAALCPRLPMNDGVFNAVSLVVPQGTVLNPTFPAPGMFRSLLSYYVVELIYGALAKVIPDKVMAPSGTYPLWIQKFAGRFDDGRPFVSHFNAQGGHGARQDRDGNSAVVFPGNIASTSVELFEVDAPMLCERKAFITDSAGPGRFRGGLGQEIVIRSLAKHRISGAASGGRFRHGAVGLDGGKEGGRGRIQFNDGEPFARSSQVFYDRGDFVRLCQPGGGGFGDPLSRDPEHVLRDVRQGVVSLAGAAADYGVAIDRDTLRVNVTETARLRTRNAAAAE